MKTKSLLLVSLVLLATAIKSNALYMDFDSVNAGNGVDATSYLSSFGVTIASNTNPGSLQIIDDRFYYSGGAVAASSPHNFLLQNVGGSPNGISYTLDFSNALASLSFTRVAIINPSAVAQWTATAYVGNTAVGSVGEGFFSGTEGAQTYTLSGAGITSLTITANGFNFAGIPSAPLDDFTGIPVPETGSTFALLVPSFLALVGAARLRRRMVKPTIAQTPMKTFLQKVARPCYTAFCCTIVLFAMGGVASTHADMITLQSDASTLGAALGPGAPSSGTLARLDTADTTGLTFLPVAVGSFGTFTPVPPGAPPGTVVVNIAPGDGENGYFLLSFSLPNNFANIQLSGSANVDDTGRVFLNGNPISPSIFSGDPNRITEFGNATFSTQDGSFFQPGMNTILISDANTGGGPSGGAFFVDITFESVPVPDASWTCALFLLGLVGTLGFKFLCRQPAKTG